MSKSEIAGLRADINKLFKKAPLLFRVLASLRPYFCPYEVIIHDVPKGTSVLDIGCGQGILLNLLFYRKIIAKGIGFEADGTRLRVAGQTAKEQGFKTLAFVDGDEPTNLLNGPFDVILMVDVMHHVAPSHQQEMFSGAAWRVAPGGRLIYKDMARSPLWCALFNRLHDLILSRQMIHYVPLDTVQQWAHEAGLRVVRSSSIRRLAYAHEILVLEKPAKIEKREHDTL